MVPDPPPTTSASQLQTYAMCPRKYALQYLWGVEPEFRSKALILGSAVHSALGWWFTERLAGKTPTIEEAEGILAADLLAGAAGSTVRWKESSPEATEAEGKRLVALYLKEHGTLAVKAVEMPFAINLEDPEGTGWVLPRRMKGYFDLVLEDDSVIEVKTSARSWQPEALDRHLQAGSYAFAWNVLHGGPSQLDVHVIVKLKREPRVEVLHVVRGERDTRWWFVAAAAIERAIEERHFPPAPGPLCPECEYARACANWTTELPSFDITRPRLAIVRDERMADALAL